MAVHRHCLAIPDQSQETNLIEYKEDGASCREDRTDPCHHVLATNEYKMSVYRYNRKKLEFFWSSISRFYLDWKTVKTRTKKESLWITRTTIQNLVHRRLIISMISEQSESNQFEIWLAKSWADLCYDRRVYQNSLQSVWLIARLSTHNGNSH